MVWAEMKMKIEQGPTGKRKEHSSIVQGQFEDFLVEGFAVLIADLKFKLSLFPGSKGSIFRDNIS